MADEPLDVDTLLGDYIAAWHAGEAPLLDAYVARAAEADRDELADLIASFLVVAPSVDPTPERVAELVAADPLIAKLTSLEDAWWDDREALAARPWGERLRALREAAGLSLGDVAGRFATAFALAPGDADRASDVLGALEAGKLDAQGVAARAARGLERLLSAPRGALAGPGAPSFGGALLRGVLPSAAAAAAPGTADPAGTDAAAAEAKPDLAAFYTPVASTDPNERAANTFAAELLAPEDGVREVLAAWQGEPPFDQLIRLSSHYGISAFSAVYKLLTAKVVDHAEVHRLRRRLTAQEHLPRYAALGLTALDDELQRHHDGGGGARTSPQLATRIARMRAELDATL